MTVDSIELTMLFCSVTPSINLLRTFFLIQLRVSKKESFSLLPSVTSILQKKNSKDLSCILSPCLFNLYAEYIMRNAGLEEAQAGIKIARRNSNNLRYSDDTTLMAESEEELKSLLMKVLIGKPISLCQLIRDAWPPASPSVGSVLSYQA